MKINPVIAAVVARLKDKIPNLAVEDWPEKPELYRLNHVRGALLVTYAGSQFAVPRDLTFVTQDVTFSFTVVTIFRQLNGRGGMLAVQDEVRAALVGVRLPDCSRKIWATSEDRPDENSGIWQGQTHFATMITQIEAEEDEDDSPLKTCALSMTEKAEAEEEEDGPPLKNPTLKDAS